MLRSRGGFLLFAKHGNGSLAWPFVELRNGDPRGIEGLFTIQNQPRYIQMVKVLTTNSVKTRGATRMAQDGSTSWPHGHAWSAEYHQGGCFLVFTAWEKPRFCCLPWASMSLFFAVLVFFFCFEAQAWNMWQTCIVSSRKPTTHAFRPLFNPFLDLWISVTQLQTLLAIYADHSLVNSSTNISQL